MSKRAIVSMANERGNYIPALNRLSASLEGNFDGDFFGFIGEESIGAPLHTDVPYGFKLYAIQKAIELGYTSILWLDSSCYAIKDLSPVFESIEKDGMVFQEAGHMLGTWSTDEQLRYFGITRDEAMNIPMIGNAGFLGFDFNNPIAVRFFELWNEAMEAGMFRGSWTNYAHECSSDKRCKGSRHDMQASSSLVYLMGLWHLANKGNEWLQYGAPTDTPNNDTVLIFAQGI